MSYLSRASIAPASLCLYLLSNPLFAGPPNCYATLDLPAPPQRGVDRVLNILVDQTTVLTPAMKESVLRLTSDWGDTGDQVRIARFSALTNGQFTELMFDAQADVAPDEEYLYNLRTLDREKLDNCLRNSQIQFRENIAAAFRKTLDMSDAKLPKSDIFYSLKLLAAGLLRNDMEIEQIVLLISDGMENSDYAAFHHGQPEHAMDSKKLMAQIKKHDLEPNWQRAKIYVYGLGYLPGKSYIRPRLLQPLKSFWSDYFTHSNGEVIQLGTPAILTMSIKNPG